MYVGIGTIIRVIGWHRYSRVVLWTTPHLLVGPSNSIGFENILIKTEVSPGRHLLSSCTWPRFNSLSGACWNEKATIFLTRSIGLDGESLGKPSLMMILMRPMSSPGLQWFWYSSSRRKEGNLRGSSSPCFDISVMSTRVSSTLPKFCLSLGKANTTGRRDNVRPLTKGLERGGAGRISN